MILRLDHVVKKFGETHAVKNISLEIPKGEICGLLGPNGAGKTTLIRMIMDIFKPDSGTITLTSGLSSERKNHIGYLPEERGLYSEVKVRETLIYFAELKGLTRAEACANTDHFLERMEMTGVAQSKIGKLSKGNQQKIQLISAIVAKPELLILDEPFSGLDPVNMALVTDVIRELRSDGVSIVLSTHQMATAESFCQEIFLINKGELILSGALEAIISGYSGNSLILEGSGALPPDSCYRVLSSERGRHKIELLDGVSTKGFMGWLAGVEFETRAIKPYRVPLSEIFIREVKRHG